MPWTSHTSRQSRLPRIVLLLVASWIVSFCVELPQTAGHFDIDLVRFEESTHPNIGDYTEEFESHEDNPLFFEDSGAAQLKPMLEYAEEQWERIFEPNNHHIEITWFWDNDLDQITIDDDGNLVIPSTSAISGDYVDNDEDGLIDFAIIRFNPNRTEWWFDPTPDDDSEFNMGQQLYRDIPTESDPSDEDPAWRYPQDTTGEPPGLFETGYFGEAPSGSVANGKRDAVTVAMHEMGHAIGGILVGQLGEEADDFDFDLDPDKVGGSQVAAYARGHSNNDDPSEATEGPKSHLAGKQALMGRNPNDRRKRPSAVDVLMLSLGSGLDDVVLDRTDFLVGNDWHVTGNWEGDRVPGPQVDAFVRHGGDVDLSGDADVRNLLVDEQSSVSTSIHSLHVIDNTTVGGTAGGVSELRVFPLGDLQTNTLEINNEGRARVDFGGLLDASVLNINDDGELWLAGTPSGAAAVDGIIAHVNNGGVLRVTGNAQVDSQLALHSLGVIDVQVSGAELRLNWFTGLDGGTMQGAGVVRQNGNVSVTDDTTITVDTYDMDGSAENTVITVNLGSTLDVDSPHIDTGGANLFHGVINVNGGMLDVETGWTLVGDLNLTQTDGAGAALLGEGGMFIQGSGELNVSGFAGIATDVIVAGTVFAAGEANFSGDASITASADLETDGANDEIDFNGPVTLAGGSYTGAGVIKFDSQVLVTANTTIGMSQADLDGDTAASVIDVQPNVTFSVASTTIDPSDEAFDAVMNLEGAFSTIVPFALDGMLNMTESLGDPPPTLNGLTDFTVSASGVVNTDGDAVINRDTIVQGTLNVSAGVTQINGDATFESTAVVTVVAGGELELNSPTIFEGGSYTGGGLIQFNGMTNINDDTTISSARVDLDGAAEDTVLNLNDSRLTLNVDQVDATTVNYNGLANVVGENARLAVNLSVPMLGWRLMSGGQLNFSNPSPTAPTVTMLSGSALTADGIINAVGPLTLAADVAVRNRLNVQTGQTNVHFGGPTRSTIHANLMATVTGLGQITIDNGTTLNLEDQSQVAVDTTNRGRLEIGFEASELSVDYSVPATATIRGFFAQTLSGELAVDLGGTTQATEYDWLEVLGMARLSGTVEATFIDGFIPSIGDVFTILTATDGRDGEFDDVVAIDESNVLGIVLTDLYTTTEAMLRVDGVFLIGDYNHDGLVNEDDLEVWQKNYGATGSAPYQSGDGDGDGDTDGRDFLIWQSHFGLKIPSSMTAATTVPEPSGVVLCLYAGLWACNCCQRLRSFQQLCHAI